MKDRRINVSVDPVKSCSGARTVACQPITSGGSIKPTFRKRRILAPVFSLNKNQYYNNRESDVPKAEKPDFSGVGRDEDESLVQPAHHRASRGTGDARLGSRR